MTTPWPFEVQVAVSVISVMLAVIGLIYVRHIVKTSGRDRPSSKPVSGFQGRILEARPDVAVFRARPWWQRTLIRTVWRVQRVFGVEGWAPRREREARAQAKSPRSKVAG